MFDIIIEEIMARKGTNRRSNRTNKRRYSTKIKRKCGGKSKGNRKVNSSTKRRATRRVRVGQRGGYGKSAYHHAIAMVGDATIQKNDSLASAYR
jgi:hypothetical protein